jgi:hypothetical protein
MNNPRNELLLQSSGVLLIHSALFLFFATIIYFLLEGNFLIKEIQFLQWDANWYLSIKENGYVFVKNSQNNTGFFPLFPFVWDITDFGTAGICILNFVLFIASFYLMVCFFEPKQKTQYLFLSIPSFFFFLVPYSESLFFLFATLILIGFKKENRSLTMVGIVLATFTRSAGTIFVPALIACAFFLSNNSTAKKRIPEYSMYIGTCIVTTLLVIYLQYIQTGIWFAAAITHKYWGHSFRIPKLPFHSWGRNEITRLDGVGLLIGITALFILLLFFISKVKKTYTETRSYYLFSLLYLGGICLSMLMFQGGDLHSLNRYIFSTPFYFIFILELEKHNFTIRKMIYAFLMLLLYWLLFGSYLHITTLFYYLVLSAFLTGFLLMYSPVKKIAKWSFIVIYVLSTLSQAYFFALFLKGGWVG